MFGLFSSTPAEKAQKLKSKVVQKYGDPLTRQKAIEQLGEQGTPEAVAVLLQRFTLTVEPQTTDASEKDRAFELICAVGAPAVEPTRAFLKESDAATSWAVRILERLVPEDIIGTLCGFVEAFGQRYSRDPEKKLVLLHWLEEKRDARIGPAVLPYLEDMGDEVQIAALRTLAAQRYAPATEPIVKLLTHAETGTRVKAAALSALADAQFDLAGWKSVLAPVLSSPWSLDAAGHLAKK